MNILILNWRDIKHPLAGGAERMLFEHATFWISKGASVAWISAAYPGCTKEEKINGIHVQRFGSHYSVHLWFLLEVLKGRFAQTDIIIDCFHFLPFFSPFVCKRKKIIALIHEVAGSVWFDNIFYPLALIGFALEPFFLRIYSNLPFITVSDSTKQELIGVGINAKNIHILHNGLTIPKMSTQYKKTTLPSLLFLNRISSDKGIEDMLKAYKIIKPLFPQASLIIAGKEQEKGTLEKLLKRFSLPDVQYVGFVPEKDKWRLLQQAWILVHPSKKEGWGLSVIEANYMGTPVVGYNVAGLSDSIVHNQTGLLVESSPQALAQAVESLLTDIKERERLSKNAKQWSKKFSWEKVTKRSWQLLQK